jgi:predicted metal-dependent phosphoesterase TrpH
MRCDLHLHSTASGMSTTPGLSRICRESYNNPADVYARCKQLGMSVVTVTDHDSIDAAEVLRQHPDFFLSEEVTVRMPSQTEIHLGVYGITERDHLEVQQRRTDFISLLMYLTERKIFFGVNHVFSGLTGHREEEDFNWFASHVPALETRNGQMCAEANRGAENLAARFGKVGTAGSDSHTLAGIAQTYTEVPGAKTVDEFLSGLRAGRGVVRGDHGSYGKLTADVYRVVRAVFAEQPWMLAALPLTSVIPFITAAHWFNEIRFCKKWIGCLEKGEPQPRMAWKMDSPVGTYWAN